MSNNYSQLPLYRGTSAIYGSIEELERLQDDHLKLSTPCYQRFGSPNTKAFEKAICELEGGFAAVATTSGLSAISTTLLAFAQFGAHFLVSRSAYHQTQNFCEFLKNFGIEIEYFSNSVSADQFEHLVKSNTKLVYIESPGSLLMEVCDIGGLLKVCNDKQIISIVDNTWSTPLHCQPLKLGADISLHSATKYITGHSDSLLGVIICNEKSFETVRTTAIRVGQSASSEDAQLGLRGLKTLSLRLKEHERQAQQFIEWLKQRPEIELIYHPTIPTHKGHQYWKKYYSGSNGVVSFKISNHFSENSIRQFINSFKNFKISYSWGGVDSLIVPISLRDKTIRLNIGLEPIQYLIEDFENSLNILNIR